MAPRERTPRPLGKCKCSASGAKMTTPRPQGKCKCASEQIIGFCKPQTRQCGDWPHRDRPGSPSRRHTPHRETRQIAARRQPQSLTDRQIANCRAETMQFAAQSRDANRFPVSAPRQCQSPHRAQTPIDCQSPHGRHTETTPIAAPSRDAKRHTESLSDRLPIVNCHRERQSPHRAETPIAAPCRESLINRLPCKVDATDCWQMHADHDRMSIAEWLVLERKSSNNREQQQQSEQKCM